VPVIISSDKTQLTSFTGHHSCYPVYLTIGNIAKHVRLTPSMRAHRLLGYLPAGKLDDSLSKDDAKLLRASLFHACMRKICQPLFGPAKDGIGLADSHGWVRHCHPILAAYVADYPEQCLVTCVRYGQACPVCDSAKDDFDLDDTGDLRNAEDTLATIAAAEAARSRDSERKILDEAGLNLVRTPFWAGWEHTNIHISITSDVLHQLVQGVGKHVVEWLVELAPSKELNRRMQCLPLAGNLRHFKNGITGLANISGAEHKAIYAQIVGCVHGLVPDRAVRATTTLLDFLYMVQYESHSTDTLEDIRSVLSEFHDLKRVFIDTGIRSRTQCANWHSTDTDTLDNVADLKIPKFHSLQHYVTSIVNFGTTDNYNTESTERLHIDLAKNAFRASNKRGFTIQMCRWLERRERVYWFATHCAWRTGQVFDARLLKARIRDGPIRSRHEPLFLADRPHHLRVPLTQLVPNGAVQGFTDALRAFLRRWHNLPSWNGFETALPLLVENTLRRLPSVQTWTHATFRLPNTQTLAAKDTVSKVYASAQHDRYDTVLVQTRGEELVGDGGLDGEWTCVQPSHAVTVLM